MSGFFFLEEKKKILKDGSRVKRHFLQKKNIQIFPLLFFFFRRGKNLCRQKEEMCWFVVTAFVMLTLRDAYERHVRVKGRKMRKEGPETERKKGERAWGKGFSGQGREERGKKKV